MASAPWSPGARRATPTSDRAASSPFDDTFVDLFNAHFRRLYRYLDRLSGEPELAADLAQEAFARLHARGSLPDHPHAWLITVAMNLFRNARSTRARHRRLLTDARAEAILADPPPSPADASIEREPNARVRAAMNRLPQRELRMLLLRAEGYSYRDIAAALGLHEGSVGTLLGRAKQMFCDAYDETGGSPR